ncbi:MAG: acetylglutamate kinase [Chloroflexaceae bacterium]|nr:acetylglutamate kinase [Chloroflexaceae bacterium]NJO04288.1 acetylglutamate kinase [Chloroflexaceae bacterium]
MQPTRAVIKVSGHNLDQPDFLDALGAALAPVQQPTVLVHGGGKEITAALEQYNLTSAFIDGLRVTSPASMEVMEMVACGRINKRVVARLVAAGHPAIGLSGVDLGLLRCVPYRPQGIDLQRVGTIVAVHTERLDALLALGWLPVFAPVALGHDDNLPYNVNADQVAQAIAGALAVHCPTELVFISNIPGVLLDGQIAPHLTAAAIEQHIQSGLIYGGMIPKVRSALDALQQGVSSVRITHMIGLADGGTRITIE